MLRRFLLLRILRVWKIASYNSKGEEEDRENK